MSAAPIRSAPRVGAAQRGRPHSVDSRTTREKTWAVFTAVAVYLAEHGYAPSVREIREVSGISSNSVVAYHLGLLEESGYLTRGDALRRTARALALTDLGRRTVPWYAEAVTP